MKFEELKNSLKENIAEGYYLVGVDEYLLSSSYNLIVKYANIEVPDLNIQKFSEGIIDCNDVVRALDTMPVFSDRKVVYLDIRMTKKSELKNVNVLNAYMVQPNQQSILIINIGNSDENFEIDKSNITIVDCNRLDFKIVSAKISSIFKAKNKIIGDKEIKLLADYCLGDLSKIIIECDKLIAYLGDKESVSVNDIQSIVTRSMEYQIFELTDALSRKDANKVYSILEDMKAKKDEYKTLPSLIFSHFRRLFHIALNTEKNNYDIAKMLGVKEYAIKMSRNQIGLFSKSNLKKINELCSNIDFDLKQSNISIDNAINLIVLTILNI